MDIVFLVDRSGSMESMGDKVYDGFNSFIKEQQVAQTQSNRVVKLTTLAFDDSISIVHDRVDLADIKSNPKDAFLPRGMTALFDAVLTGTQMMDINHKTCKSKVLFVILTDGQENASTKMTSHHVFNKLIRSKRAQGWEFVFLAANQDAIVTGQHFGFSQNACLTFGADEKSCQAMMSRFSKQIQRSITVPDSQVEFSKLDRELSQSGHAPQPVPIGHVTQETEQMESSQLPDDMMDLLGTIKKRARITRSKTLPASTS